MKREQGIAEKVAPGMEAKPKEFVEKCAGFTTMFKCAIKTLIIRRATDFNLI
jgi:hypothetical protein